MSGKTSKTSLLLFDWQGRDSSLLRMGLALAVTLAAFVGMFIVFRVVTPDSRPAEVRPQRVIMLDAAVPAERALIHKAMDQSFGMLSSEATVTLPVKNLERPRFRPSFTDHELRLKPMPPGLAATPRPLPLTLDLDVLPEVARQPLAPGGRAQPAPPHVLRAVVEGELATRLPRSLEISGVPLADATRPRFQVAVGPLGQVLMALPLLGSDDASIQQKLHHAVLQLKFAPAAAEIQWGQVSFQWEEVKAP